jgi:hypothetical protein
VKARGLDLKAIAAGYADGRDGAIESGLATSRRIASLLS